MTTTLLFNLRLGDMMSGMMPKVASATQNAMSKAEAAVEKVRRAMGGSGAAARKMGEDLNTAGTTGARGVNKIGEAADDAARKMRNLNNEVRNTQRGGRSLWDMAKGSFVGNLGADLVQQGVSALIGQGKSVIGAGLETSIQRSDYNTMLGAGNGDALYDSLNKWIADSIYGKEQFGIAQMLLGYGDNQILPDLKMIGDVAGSNTQKEESLARAFGQTLTKGRLQGGEAMQFNEAGFNPLSEISLMTGKSVAELTKEMEKGAITFDMVRAAFVHATSEGGRFHNRLNNLANTPGGRVQLMEGNLSLAKQQFGEKLMPVLGRVLDRLMPMLDKLPALFDRMMPGIERVANNFMDSLPKTFDFLENIATALTPVFDLLTSKEVQDLGRNLMDLSGTMIKELTPAIKLAASALESLVKPINWILNQLPNDAKSLSAGMEKAREREMQGYFAAHPNMTDAERAQYIADKRDPGAAIARKSKESKEQAQWMWDMLHPKKTEAMRSAASMSGANAVSESIIGGGRRVINVTFRNIVENWISQGSGVGGDKRDVTERELKEMINRLFLGLPSM